MSDEQQPLYRGDPGLGGTVGPHASAGPLNGVKPQSAKYVNGGYSADRNPGASADPNNGYGGGMPQGKVNGHTGMNGHIGGVEPTGLSQPSTDRLTGVCKNWAKGYGFISRNDGQGDVFVHQTQIRKNGFRSLQIGEQVEFDIETKEDGRKQAVNVTGPNGADVIGQERPPQNQYGGRGGGGGGYSRGGRGGGGYSRGGYNQGGAQQRFQAAPYGSQPNFGQGYTPFIQQPYAYGQATTGFGQASPYPQPGQPPAQYAQPVASPYAQAPAQFAPGTAQSPYGAMAAYAQASSAPQGDPAKGASPRVPQGQPSSYGQQSGYGQAAYTQAAATE